MSGDNRFCISTVLLHLVIMLKPLGLLITFEIQDKGVLCFNLKLANFIQIIKGRELQKCKEKNQTMVLSYIKRLLFSL